MPRNISTSRAEEKTATFPRHGNTGQPRRQGEAPRHSRLEVRRRVSAVFSP
jgi:hypothetical protein